MNRFFFRSSSLMPGTGRMTVLILSVVSMIIIIVSCSGDEDNPITAQLPVFSATPVDIAYDISDSTFGDMIFVTPVLTPFGASLGNERYSFGMEYFTVLNAPVRAVTEGIVDTIIENPIVGDYEVRVVSIPGSDYLVIYDHVLNATVTPASLLMPGDTLGKAGTWNDSTSRTLLSIRTGEGTNERYYCPMSFGDSGFIEQHNALLREYNRLGFQPAYDSLCLRGVMTP